MGLGPPIIALYHQLKELGLFDNVNSVVELGSQNVWCPHRHMMRDLFRTFGQYAPSDKLLEDFANWKGAARDLYENLGMQYACLDVDERFGSLMLDLNFDEIPSEHRDRYDLTTNHGTSEHVLNQYNVFKMVHDLTRPGGLILHAVTFTVHLEHGFFNYHPQFFRALGMVNSYETLGVWVGPDWEVSSLVPWHPSLLDYLVISPKTTHLLVVLQRKTAAREFRTPRPRRLPTFEEYGTGALYCHVVDGEYYDGARDRFVTASGATLLRPVRSLAARPISPLVETAAEEAIEETSGGVRSDPSVGPLVLALYRQLKALGPLDNVQSVVELGSQRVDVVQKSLVLDLFRGFGQTHPSAALTDRIARGEARAREVYEALGLTCTSVALESEAEVLKLDLNFDSVPIDHRSRYDLATNVGTSGYVLNQLNVFKLVHDFTRPNGLMLHVVPFTVQLERAFFSYQPNFFNALARYNSYRMLGMWIGVDPQYPDLIPWQPSLLNYLTLSSKTVHVMVVLLQRMYPNEFCVPFQEVYESTVPKRALARYRMVIDGKDSDAATGARPGTQPHVALHDVAPTQQSLSMVPGSELVRELRRRIDLRVRNFFSGRFRAAFAKPMVTRKQR